MNRDNSSSLRLISQTEMAAACARQDALRISLAYLSEKQELAIKTWPPERTPVRQDESNGRRWRRKSLSWIIICLQLIYLCPD